MPRFQLQDVVALAHDRRFVGLIQRTSQFEAEPLDDRLIIAHTEVPEHIFTQFVTSGRPPYGYVFIEFVAQEQGSSLVKEDDIFLVDRRFDVGDVVKQTGSRSTGTVVNVSISYVLDPVWQPALTASGFAAIPANQLPPRPPYETDLTQHCEIDFPLYNAYPHRLIPGVPFEELKRAQDFMEGDYIIEQEWLGVLDMIDTADLLVVIKLENDSVVVVEDPEELFTPIPDFGKPYVSMPEYDGIPRPHIVSAMQGYGAVIPAEELESGQFVATNQTNLKNGRWLRGSHDPNVKPQGHVLMVRCRQLDVQWLTCNAYTPENHKDMKEPDDLAPYENLTTFPRPQELRTDKRVVILDPSKPSPLLENRTRMAELLPREQLTLKNTCPINLSSTFDVGVQVKFRDPAGAAVKYQGRERGAGGLRYGRFDRIPHNETFGYDLNEFRIFHSEQKVVVRWQDGKTSPHKSVDMEKINLLDADFMPGDIVVAREGMKQQFECSQHQHNSRLMDFNEMTFFEKPHSLLPAKVGIVQIVDTSERIAQIRWFAEPKLRITASGNCLSYDSRFGPISNDMEHVSLYEVMTFPALARKLRDVVTIAPSCPSSKAIDLIRYSTTAESSGPDLSTNNLSQVPDRRPPTLLRVMQNRARLVAGDLPQPTAESEQYKPHRSIDWVGEICQLRTDGFVVLRVNAGDQGKDILIEHDQIICFVDDPGFVFDYNDDPMDIDELDESEGSFITDESEDVLSELVEYEGGQRIDNDSGDENWESEDEVRNSDVQSNAAIGAMVDVVHPQESLPGFGGQNRAGSLSVIDSSALNARNSSTTSLPARDGMDLVPETRQTSNLNESRMADVSNASRVFVDPQNDLLSSTSQTLAALSTPAMPARPQRRLLASYLPETEPSSFLSLDREPPTDQFRVSQRPSTSPAFLKRIAKEHRILSSSLPDGEIYVRTYDSRLDLLRCLIIGPLNTPYENAPFLIDLHLGSGFPCEPPTAHFHSWTSGLGRINPNLYEEGKICLSLLGTWPGKSESEGWTEKATILQLLVSLQGLVFVKAPFYNEAGFEGYEETKEYTNESFLYTEKAYVMGRNFIKHALSSPVAGIEDVLAWTYLTKSRHGGQPAAALQTGTGLLETVIQRSKALISWCEESRGPSEQLGGMVDEDDRLLDGEGRSDDETRVFLRPLSKGAFVMLSKTLNALREIWGAETLAMVARPQGDLL